MLVLIINITSNLGLKNVHFSFFIVRELKEAHRSPLPPSAEGGPGVTSEAQHTNLCSAHNPHSSEGRPGEPRQVHTRPAT